MIRPSVCNGISPRTRLLALWSLAAVAVQCAVVMAISSQDILHGAVGRRGLTGDDAIYFRYVARALDQGLVPYRDFRIEYPIGAFGLFVLPRLLVTSFRDYVFAFGALMMAFNAAAVFLLARFVADNEGLRRVPRRLAWYTVAFASVCPLLIYRFDLAMMAVSFAGAVFWLGRRPAAGGALVALGVLMKIVPGVMVGPALLGELRTWRTGRLRGFAAFCVVLAAGMGGWLALGGPEVITSLRYHTDRGLEIGSLYASIALADSALTGAPVATANRFCCTEIDSPWTEAMCRMAMPLQLLALGLVAWRSRRSESAADGVRYAGAMLLAYIAFGKVLSPQYVIWLFPFVAALDGPRGRRARMLFLLCCVMTTMIYPWAFNRLLRFEPWAIGLLVYRNLLLIGLLGLLVAERIPAAATAGAREASAPVPSLLPG